MIVFQVILSCLPFSCLLLTAAVLWDAAKQVTCMRNFFVLQAIQLTPVVGDTTLGDQNVPCFSSRTVQAASTPISNHQSWRSWRKKHVVYSQAQSKGKWDLSPFDFSAKCQLFFWWLKLILSEKSWRWSTSPACMLTRNCQSRVLCRKPSVWSANQVITLMFMIQSQYKWCTHDGVLVLHISDSSYHIRILQLY